MPCIGRVVGIRSKERRGSRRGPAMNDLPSVHGISIATAKTSANARIGQLRGTCWCRMSSGRPTGAIMNIHHLVPIRKPAGSLSMGFLVCWRRATRQGRRPLEVQAHRAAVHRGAGRRRGHLRQWRAASVGLPESGSGQTARAIWTTTPQYEGDRRGHIRTVLKFDASDWWLEEHGLIMEEADLSRWLLGNTSSRVTAR